MADPVEVWTALLAGLWLCGPPSEAEERGVVELGIAAEVLYPPASKTPRRHPTYGAAVSASLYGDGRFKAMVGLGFDHVVYGWLGDPQKCLTADSGALAGTAPA